MKKIILFNQGTYLYGAEQGLLHLLEALHDEYAVTVVLPRDGVLGALIREKFPSVEIKLFPLAYFTRSFSPLYFLYFMATAVAGFFYLLFYLKQSEFDMVITNSLILPLPAVIARFLKIPHFWYARELFPSNRLNRLVGLFVRRFSRTVICQSCFIRESLRLKDSSTVVYEPVIMSPYQLGDAKEARRALDIPEGTLVISVIGRIHPSRGQYEFIQEHSTFLRNNPRLIVLIAGDISARTYRNARYKRSLLSFIARNNLHHVKLVGLRKDIDRILCASDICVFPFKRAEPYGMAAAEALACGITCFFPFRGGLREIRKLFGAGIRYTPGAVEKYIDGRGFSQREPSSFCIPKALSFDTYKKALIRVIGQCDG